ncbi:hypothetical protein [Nocardioides sp.]|uniref:hypothetical protein n=1 Tax=Nocardioides sp. TaxID=35761 RepID=UPI003783E55E
MSVRLAPSVASAPRIPADLLAGLDWIVPERPASLAVIDVSPMAAGARVIAAVAGQHWLSGDAILQPVRVELSAPGDGALIAREPSTGIHGVGSSPSAALNDLRAALVEHLELLEAAPALSDDLSRQLTFLRAHVRTA